MIAKFVHSLSEMERRVFYIAALFVTLALLDRLFISPILGHIERLDKEIETEKINIMRDQRFLAYKDRIEAEAAEFKPYFTENVPDDDVVNAEFLKQIEMMATQTSVALVKSNPSHVEKNEKSIEYFANVDCSGTLENVIAFMHKVNSADSLLKIIKFNMTPKRGVENEVKISMTIVKLIVH